MTLDEELEQLLAEATRTAAEAGGAPRKDGELPCAAPGAEALIAHRGEILSHQHAGMSVLFDQDGSLLPASQQRAVSSEELWDIASLTKVAVAVAAMVQHQRGSLDLDAPVVEYLPEFETDDDAATSPLSRRHVLIRHLLNHTSGLSSVARPWTVPGGRDDRAAYLLSRPLERTPGESHVYSCVGFMTLGLALERITGLQLPELIAETVTGPLGMESTSYTPQPGLPVAATEYDTTTGRGLVVGEVHDEAAGALGGSGNAGLFSTAADIFRLGEEIRTGSAGVLSPAGRQLLSTGTLSAAEHERVGYNQSMGLRMGQFGFMGTGDTQVLGHTGFVGTSLVIDPIDDLVVVLLTNNVHPHRDAFMLMPLRRAVAAAARRAVT